MGCDGLRIETGAHDIHTIQPGLGRDAVLAALPGERRIGDGDIKVLADLLAVDLPSDGLVDRRGIFSVSGADGAGDLFERLFRRGEKILAFAGPLLLQAWIETDHEPLARTGVMRHLGHGIRDQLLRLQGRGMIVDRFEQLADIGGGEGRDPVDHRWLEIVADAAGGDHAPVSHKSDLGEAETVPDLVHLCGECGGVRDIPLEHLNRGRAAIRGAQEAIDDLFLALLAVPIIAELRQRTTAPFNVAG